MKVGSKVKEWARAQTADAISRGVLVVQPCKGCGTCEDVQAHHEDYTKPLEITWLCPPCHGARHLELSHKTKPRKPFPTFPLTPHIRGGWVKKYKGRIHSISIPDPDLALEEWFRRKRAIDQGHVPAKLPLENPFGPTTGEIANRFVRERRLDMEAGRLAPSTFEDYKAASLEMVEVLGRDTPVSELKPDDFTRLFRHWSKRLGAHALARNIQCVRTLWNRADEDEWISRRPRFGSSFKKPVAGKKGGTPLEASDVLRLAAACSNLQLEAMILLMINCGFTAKDCSELPRSAIHLERQVIIFPRPKMKRRRPIERVCPLWPETVEALGEVLEQRKADADGLVFRTIHGHRWVRTVVSKKGKRGDIDSVGRLFRRLCGEIGIEERGPAWIRHLFRTLADELEKPHATARIMGHRLTGLAEVYVDRIEHDRLLEVTNHVRSRFLARHAQGAAGSSGAPSDGPSQPHPSPAPR